VFGKITSGMDVVKKIEGSPTGGNDRPRTPIKMVKVTVSE
jgi:cyclophilin family peptidyl-prolyl cis-trans isomerase